MSDEAYEDETAWLDERLAEAGRRRTGPVEPERVRPWATVLRAPTDGGVVFLKAPAPVVAFEVGLYPLLVEAGGDLVLEPLAVDTDAGRLLLPAGGTPLGGGRAAGEVLDRLAEVLPRYAELQRALAPRADEVLALGVADMRPAMLPARFAEAVERIGPWVDDRGTPDERAVWARVTALGEQVGRWADELAAAPGGASIDHNDLHAWNVLAGADGRLRLYDWGDAVVAHPFASMLVAASFAQQHLAADPRAIERLRDAYLEPWSDLAPHAELVRTLELACRAGKTARALVWERLALGSEEGWDRGAYATMAALLDDSWFGGA